MGRKGVWSVVLAPTRSSGLGPWPRLARHGRARAPGAKTRASDSPSFADSECARPSAQPVKMHWAYLTPSLQLARWPSTTLADGMSAIWRAKKSWLIDECIKHPKQADTAYIHGDDGSPSRLPSLPNPPQTSNLKPQGSSTRAAPAPPHEPVSAIAMHLWQLRPV